MRSNCATTQPRKKKGALAFALPAFGQATSNDKPHCAPQETEGYIDLFYDSRVAPRVNQHAAEEGHKGPQINLIRAVALDMYEDEDEETHAAVRAHLAAQLEERNTEAKGAQQPTPQQYQQ